MAEVTGGHLAARQNPGRQRYGHEGLGCSAHGSFRRLAWTLTQPTGRSAGPGESELHGVCSCKQPNKPLSLNLIQLPLILVNGPWPLGNTEMQGPRGSTSAQTCPYLDPGCGDNSIGNTMSSTDKARRCCLLVEVTGGRWKQGHGAEVTGVWPGKCGKVNTPLSLWSYSLFCVSCGLFLLGGISAAPAGGLHVSLYMSAAQGSRPAQDSGLGTQFSSGDYFRMHGLAISVPM